VFGIVGGVAVGFKCIFVLFISLIEASPSLFYVCLVTVWALVCMCLSACICLGSCVSALAISGECCWSLVLSSGQSF